MELENLAALFYSATAQISTNRSLRCRRLVDFISSRFNFLYILRVPDSRRIMRNPQVKFNNEAAFCYILSIFAICID